MWESTGQRDTDVPDKKRNQEGHQRQRIEMERDIEKEEESGGCWEGHRRSS